MELQKLVAGSADKEEEILRFVHGTNVRAWELLGCGLLFAGVVLSQLPVGIFTKKV